MITDDLWQTEGVNDRVQLSRDERRDEPPDPAALDAARGDRGRPGDDLGARLGRPGPRRHAAARHLAGGRDLGRRRGDHRPRHHAGRRRGGGGRDGGPHARGAERDRRRTPASARTRRCGRAPRSAPAARSAPSWRPRTPSSGPGPRCRTWPTSGDAVIGDGANIGAGVIFANYDGVHKATTHGRARTASWAATRCSPHPVDIADGALRRRRLDDHRRRRGRASWRSAAAGSATCRAGWPGNGRGPRRPEAAEAALDEPQEGLRRVTGCQEAQRQAHDAVRGPGLPRAGRGDRRR